MYVYVVKTRRTEGNIAAWSFLTHTEKYNQDAFDAQVKECEEFVNTVRIPKRRQATADNKVVVENPPEINDTLFEDDAEFVEAMLIDRFGYKKLVWAGAEALIIPTIVGLG